MNNNKKLGESIIACTIQLSKRHHEENMNNKVHSIHCIIHKNRHKYIQQNEHNINNNNININNANEIEGRYACDFRYENMNTRLYMQFLNAKCAYFNENYIQYEEQAIHDLTREFILG